MSDHHHHHASTCLVRFLEAHQERDLAEIALARRARGDDVAELFFLFANHRTELLSDLRAGTALRQVEQFDLVAVRRNEAQVAAQTDPVHGRWVVGSTERQAAAVGDSLEGALAKLDQQLMQRAMAREPGRN